jgi:hypothetical protein
VVVAKAKQGSGSLGVEASGIVGRLVELYESIGLPCEYNRHVSSVRQLSRPWVQDSACPALRVEMHATQAHMIRFKPSWIAVLTYGSQSISSC